MGFASAIAVGQREREQNMPNLGPSALESMNAIRRPVMEGFIQRPAQSSTSVGLNPGEIHRQAAEIAMTQTQLENEKTRATIANVNEQTAALRTKRMNEPMDTYYDRSKAIESGYQERLKGSAMDEALTQQRKDVAQGEDYKKAMLGISMRDGNAVKNFINNYGDPNTNVANVIFGPENDPGIILEYEDGKKSYFKDPEQFYKGFMWWMDPKSQKIVEEKMKSEKTARTEEEKRVVDKVTIIDKLKKQYREDFTDVAGNVKKDAPPMEQWISDEYQKQTGRTLEKTDLQAGAVRKPTTETATPSRATPPSAPPAKGAIQERRTIGEQALDYSMGEGGLTTEGQVAAGAPVAKGKIRKPPVEGARWSEERQAWFVQKDGKWHKVNEETMKQEGNQPGGRKGKPTGKVSFTDPETKKKVTRTYYRDGTYDEE